MYSKYADDEGQGLEIIVLPVPYEGAISYGSGTREGPRAILRASLEIETWDQELGYDLLDIVKFRTLEYFEPPVEGPKMVFQSLYSLLKFGFDPSKHFFLTIGGDHSVALAPIKFYRDFYDNLYVIQVDAHSDLRSCFQQSKYSHGSVMARVRDFNTPIIQLGIRSLCKEESQRIHDDPMIHTFFAWDIINTPPEIIARDVRKIIKDSPIYISFDVDGIDPGAIPGTGTPEPGGIPFLWIQDFWRYLFKGKNKLVGMDVCELSPIPNQVLSESCAVKCINRILTSYLLQSSKELDFE